MAMNKKRKPISEKDFAREEEKLLRMLEEVSLFESDIEADKQWRIDQCRDDYQEFQRTYFSHYLEVEDAPMHGEVIEACQIEEKPVRIVMPRGFGKSTKVSFIFVLWCIVYRKKKFGVLMMESWDKAEMQTWRILLELKHNPRLFHDFGQLVKVDASRSDFTTLSGFRLVALGAGMSARGLVNGPHRPDLFICDDIESRALARNPRRVEQLIDIILADYLNCMCDDGWTFILVGTIICRGSTMDQLGENEEFKHLFFQAEVTLPDGTRDSAWPEKVSYKKLQQMRAIIGETRYAAEKMNEPMETEGSFNEKWFRHYNHLPEGITLSDSIIVQDPSYTATGDNKATFVLNLYQHTNMKPVWKDSHGAAFPEGEYVIILEARNRKESIDDMILATFEMHRRWKFEIHVDGSVNQKAVFGREYARYEAKLGLLPLKFIKLIDDKDARIAALESPIQRGFLVFPPRTNKDIEETIRQFTRFGNPGVPKDGPDALAFGAKILEKKVKKKARVYI